MLTENDHQRRFGHGRLRRRDADRFPDADPRMTGPPMCEWCPPRNPAPATFSLRRECLRGHDRTILLCGIHTTSAVTIVRFCAECAPDRTVITLSATPL